MSFHLRRKAEGGSSISEIPAGEEILPTTLSHPLPVNDSLVLREAEYSGSGVSFLRLGSHTSDLNKTKAQLIEAIHSFPMFVKSCSNPYWISEFMAQDSHFLERRKGQRCTWLHQMVLTAGLPASCIRSPLELAEHQWAHRIGIFGRKDTLRCLSAGASDVCWSLTPEASRLRERPMPPQENRRQVLICTIMVALLIYSTWAGGVLGYRQPLGHATRTPVSTTQPSLSPTSSIQAPVDPSSMTDQKPAAMGIMESWREDTGRHWCWFQ